MTIAVPFGVNFRSSSGFVTDVAPDVWSGNGSPAYAAGPGYGWVSGNLTGANDQQTTPIELAGMAYQAAAADPTASLYRIDTGAGAFKLRLALGDFANPHTNYSVKFFDSAGGTPLLTISGTSIAAGNYVDATGVNRTSGSDWVTNNALSGNITIAGTYLRIEIGTGPSGAGDYTCISHLGIEAGTATAKLRRYNQLTGLGGSGPFFSDIL